MSQDLREGEQRLLDELKRMANSGEFAVLRKRKDDQEKPHIDENSKRIDKPK
ncbi:hypothetical protein [Burkholderia gladioli]|uniref:hypothetical protein n=1 Tax=Burkholderia gladioli TaxID=28095 RepID=UPI0016403F5A|nr:hypothetical protein [Burkholderia gladioli]